MKIDVDKLWYLLHSKIKTGKYAHITFAEKFWSQVNIKDESECWEFMGKLYSNGYGCFKLNHYDLLAHRVSYLLHNRRINSELVVMHKCDNRSCVNPYHLREGTTSDNIQDMLQKQRNNTDPVRGENNHLSKISNQDAIDICEMRKNKIPVKDIAKQYKISAVQIYRITTGSRWNWLNQIKGI